MVDNARALLDELMGRSRNLEPSNRKALSWEDPKFCSYYLVKFCPHEIFMNTKADFGPCLKLHDEEAKRLFQAAKYSTIKRQHYSEFLRICNSLLEDVERKIRTGKRRISARKSGEGGQIYVSKFQENINYIDARIGKLVQEAEEAGLRGDVDQAKSLITLCDQLNEGKQRLLQSNGVPSPEASSKNEEPSSEPIWESIYKSPSERQMELCEVCGAFLMIGDIQQHSDDHFTGKLHVGFLKLRQAAQDVREEMRNVHDRVPLAKETSDNRHSQEEDMDVDRSRRRRRAVTRNRRRLRRSRSRS